MKVNVVTKNRTKFLEIEDVLEKNGIEAVQKSVEVFEHGETIEKRARSKALAGYNIFSEPVIADDTGVFFHAFQNFPGPFPKKVSMRLVLKVL